MKIDGAPRAHGGPDEDELRALGLDARSILDFSVNVNPYGPTDFMREAIRAAAIERYPDRTASSARAALAAAWSVDPARLVLGAGAAELLWTVVRAVVHAGDPVLIAEPTFSEARAAAESAAAIVHELRATAETRFQHAPGRLTEAVASLGARLVYVCTPNNPTGLPWPAAELADVIARCPGALFLVDQSFLSLSDRHADAAVELPANAVRIRSLTKDHAIPGARVGALVATPGLAHLFETARPAWSAGAVTQAAAIAAAAPAEQAFVAESRARLLADRMALAEDLRALGWSALPSSTTFLMASLPDAAATRARLLREHGILVRSCASFGLPDHLRLAARPAGDRARLVSALSSLGFPPR
jgi:histidinol-phosphate/aromatic aminotransferase/cobyric acid decarboxylase-like protein